MGVFDFEAAFDILDPARRGEIGVDEIQTFDSSLHFSPLSRAQIVASIGQICGRESHERVAKDRFNEVMHDLERRRKVEETVRWDFMALDKTGNNRLPLNDVLTLFKLSHGDNFSLKSWNDFANSREDRNAEVCFDEVCLALCNVPQSSPSTIDEISDEQQRLRTSAYEHNEQEFQTIQKHENDDKFNRRKKQEYKEQTKRLARRKHNMWEENGVEALIYDDGVDKGEAVPSRISSNKNSVGINDLLDALITKYDVIRRKLFVEMLQNHHGTSDWGSLSDTDQYEAIEHLKSEESQMRQEYSLVQYANTLPGTALTHNLSVSGLIGDLKWEHAKLTEKMKDQRAKLRSEGKTDEEIYDIFSTQFSPSATGIRCGSDQILIELNKRFEEEKEHLLGDMQGGSGSKVTPAGLLVEYCLLKRQRRMAESEDQFQAAVIATGLGERQQIYRNEQFDPDRVRQESLAGGRVAQQKRQDFKSKFLNDVSGAKSKNSGVVEAQIEVVEEITLKNALERETLLELLTGKHSYEAKANARKLGKDQRKSEVASLRSAFSRWKNSSDEQKVANKKSQTKILQKALSVYYQDRSDEIKAEKNYVVEDNVHTSILTDLQQKQDQEFYRVLISLKNKTPKDIGGIRKEHYHARRGNFCDNIAAVVMGTFECNEEEKLFIGALEEKYEAMRNAFLLSTLIAEHGHAWHRLNPNDKAKMLSKKQEMEKKLRQSGQMSELASLEPDVTTNLFPMGHTTVYSQLGEDRSAFSARINKFSGDEQESMEDEPPGTCVKSTNILADINSRFYSEQEAILTIIRSQEEQQKSFAERMVLLARIHLETKMVGNAPLFEQSAMLCGLTERIQTISQFGKRFPADRARNEALVTFVTKPFAAGNGIKFALTTDLRPDRGDLVGWQTSLLWESFMKHNSNMEMLLRLLTDSSMEELLEVARSMPKEEQLKRLNELYRKHKQLNFDIADDRDENLTIMEEAAAIKFVLRQNTLNDADKDTDAEAVIVSLVLELIDLHEREIASYVGRLGVLSEEELKINRESEITARENEAHTDVVTVLTNYEGAAENDELLKALDEKYDELRLKMLTDALMKELGEEEWKRLSEQERQRKVLEMKRKERRLRKEGKYDELAALLGQDKENQDALNKLLGDSKAEFDRKLKEKLERRKLRQQQGLDPDEDDGEIEEGTPDVTLNPLDNLQMRYEQEKEALLARLRGVNDDLMGERERQAELVRLKREKRKAQQEDTFESAAKIVGLAERQQAANSERLKNDRLRQEDLAKHKIEEMKKKRQQKKIDESVVSEGDRVALQDAVMTKLESYHEDERFMFNDMLNQKVPDKLRKLAKSCNEFEKDEKIKEFSDARDKLSAEQTKQNKEALVNATVYKIEKRREILARSSEEPVTDNDVHVSLMADLQDKQDKEAEEYLRQFPNNDDDDLIQLQSQIVYEHKHQRGDNIAAVVFGIDLTKHANETELIDALKGKYDALKDKLLMEGIMSQYSEAEWTRMSEQERQRKLVELRIKEKKLLMDGRYEDAAALLGEAAKNHELIENLFGQTKEEQNAKVQERLRKRRERLAQGISEEECDNLEEQDKQEEKKKRNVLQDLEGAFEKEKEELLNRLKKHQDHVSSERERQLELSRLKREQRRAQLEEKFESAAMLIGMSKEHGKTLEEQRDQQEKLAKERLQARLDARKKAVLLKQAEQDVPVPLDDDIPALNEALSAEMERKHMLEREFLIQLLRDPETAKHQDDVLNLGIDGLALRQEQLRYQRKAWRAAGSGHPDEQTVIMQEATAIKLGLVLFDQPNASDEDIQVLLLADLQQEQDKELNNTLHSAKGKSANELRDLMQAHAHCRKVRWYDNAATVVIGAVQTSGDKLPEEMIKAVESLYQVTRDQLFKDVCIKQRGQAEWDGLSDQDKQGLLIKLRLKVNDLTGAGNFDEASSLLRVDDEQGHIAKLGVSIGQLRKMLDMRESVKNEIVEDRKANNLSNDGEVVEALVDTELMKRISENKVNRNILEELNNHQESHVEHLKTAMDNKDGRFSSEKGIKVEIAKMKRNRVKLELEEAFSSSSVLLNIIELTQLDEGKTLVQEENLPEELAKERLKDKMANASKKPMEADAGLIQEQLDEEAADKKAQEAINGARGAGKDEDSIAESLTILEKRQAYAREILLSIIAAAKSDPEIQQYTLNIDAQEAKVEMESMRQERKKWRRESAAASLQLDDYDHQMIAKQRESQYKNMLKSTALKFKVETSSYKEKHPDASDEDAFMSIAVSIMSSLQRKQEAESNAVLKIATEEDDSKISELNKTQEMAFKLGWFDNVANAVYERGSSHTDSEVDELFGSQQASLKYELEQELVEQKKALEERAKLGEDVDVEAELAKLAAQQNAREETMRASLERQQQLLRKRLDAKRRMKESREYEQEAATAMIIMAEKQHENANKKVSNEKDRQSNMGDDESQLDGIESSGDAEEIEGSKKRKPSLWASALVKLQMATVMQQRLAARRDARKKAAEEKEIQDSEDISSRPSSSGSRPRSMDSNVMPSMAREKSVVDINLSEEQKNELYMQLVQDQVKVNRKLDAEHKKHEEQLKRRLEEMKGKRMNETTALLSMAERQKTTLEKQRKEEHDRQLEKTRERVARVRYEKTMTMKQKGDQNARKFDELVSEGGSMSKDEQMQLAAKQMEEQFKRSEKDVAAEYADSQGQPSRGATGGGLETSGSQKLSNEEKMRQLKQRREAKRKQRKSEDV